MNLFKKIGTFWRMVWTEEPQKVESDVYYKERDDGWIAAVWEGTNYDDLPDGITPLLVNDLTRNPVCLVTGSSLDLTYTHYPNGPDGGKHVEKLISHVALENMLIDKAEICYVKNVRGYENGFAGFVGKQQR